MNDHDYAWEKLHYAVQSLAESDDQRKALLNVMVSHICRLQAEHDLPPEIRDDFTEMMRKMTKISVIGTAGGYEVNIDNLSDAAIQKTIDQIKSFYAAVCKHRELG
jgi:hypothetical protein